MDLWKALGLAIFHHAEYVKLDVAGNMALAETDPVLAKLYAEQPSRRAEQWSVFELDAYRRARELRTRLISSFMMVVGTCSASLVAASLADVVALQLPLSATKACNFTGTALVAWATLLALGTNRTYWDGPPLTEHLVPLAFRVIFLPGVLLIALGSLL